VNSGPSPRRQNCRWPNMQGGTFTISNGGVYGSLMSSSPILNPRSRVILGLHKIQAGHGDQWSVCDPSDDVIGAELMTRID